MRKPIVTAALILTTFFATSIAAGQAPSVTVGSKSFTESVVLGEILAGLAREVGATAHHRK